MQLEGILNLILDPLVLILLVGVIIIIIVAVIRRGPKAPAGPPIIKTMVKMKSSVEKEKKIEMPAVKSRQQIITDVFESNLREIGLEPAEVGGYIPLVASSDLSQKLVVYKEESGKIGDDEIEATIEGIHAAEKSHEVDDIAETVAELLDLDDDEKEELRQLARQEWDRHKDA